MVQSAALYSLQKYLRPAFSTARVFSYPRPLEALVRSSHYGKSASLYRTRSEHAFSISGTTLKADIELRLTFGRSAFTL